MKICSHRGTFQPSNRQDCLLHGNQDFIACSLPQERSLTSPQTGAWSQPSPLSVLRRRLLLVEMGVGVPVRWTGRGTNIRAMPAELFALQSMLDRFILASKLKEATYSGQAAPYGGLTLPPQEWGCGGREGGGQVSISILVRQEHHLHHIQYPGAV